MEIDSNTLPTTAGIAPVPVPPTTEERSRSLDREPSRGETQQLGTSERCPVEGGEDDGGEFESCTKIVKELLEGRKSANESSSSIDSRDTLETAHTGTNESLCSDRRSDESMEDKGVGESVGKEVPREGGSEAAKVENTTPQKKKQSGSRSKKTKLSRDEEGPCEGDAVSTTATTTNTPKKRGRPRKLKEGETYSPPCRQKHPHISRLPGSRLKICSHCGTVADKPKAKKCLKCKKFFFSHWAQRCKIPPCPNCHFSRKSRRFERTPSNCEKCGFKLPYELIEQTAAASATADDGDGVESVESGSTSARVTPDPSEADSIPADWGDGKPDECCEEVEGDDVEVEGEVVEKRPGKGKGKMNQQEAGEVSSTVGKPSVAQLAPGKSSIADGTSTIVMATTRSGRAYKHEMTPEACYTSLVPGARSAETPSPAKGARKGSLQEDTPNKDATNPLKEQSTSTSDMVRGSSCDILMSSTGTSTRDSEPLQDTIPQTSSATEREPFRGSPDSYTKEAAVSTHSPSTPPPAEPSLTPHEATQPLLAHSPLEEQEEEAVQGVDTAQQCSTSVAGLLVDQETQVAPCGASSNDQLDTVGERGSAGPVDESGREEIESGAGGVSKAEVVSGFAGQEVRETSMEVESRLTPVRQPAPELATLSSGVQTEGNDDSEDRVDDEDRKLEVFTNIDRSVPFLQSVLSSVQSVSEQGGSDRPHTATSVKDVATGTASTTSGGSQSLPVLYTSTLGLEDKSQQLKPPALSTEADLLTLVSSTSTVIRTTSTTETTAVPVTPVYVPTAVSALAAVCDKDAVDMVVTESGTLPPVTGSPPCETTDSTPAVKEEQPPPATQKPGKGKRAVGKDGKPVTSRKKKQPKTQEKKEETKKPRKPRAKKSKVMAATAPLVPEGQSTATISMLATSIAQELQRKPSQIVMGQHSKHSFSQYFYSEGQMPQSVNFGALASAPGSSISWFEDIEGSGSTNTKSTGKRSPSKGKDLQEPPPKKKKLAAIAPNNPLVSTANPAVSMGQLPLKLPQLCQLASSFRMSSSNLLSLLQTVLSTQTPGSTTIAGSSNAISTVASSSVPPAAPNPSSLPPNLFPPLTMSFQSLAAALSNMPIATTPIRLSGTQVTARPLLPSTVPSSASGSSPSMNTLPLSLPAVFSSLAPPASVSTELAQSEASVGTQTAVKMDSLKSLVPAISSSLSPQLLTLPNPPQLTSALPPPPRLSLVPKDLNPAFQSVLPGQHPSPPPPPLTSSLLATDTTTTSTTAVPLPVIQSNTTSQYMTFPMSSASMFTSFLPTHASTVSLPSEKTGILPAEVPPSGEESDVQPLLISSLPDLVTTTNTLSGSLTGLGSLLPPPPHLLPQPPLNLPSSSSIFPSSPNPTTAPLIPSLLRPGVTAMSATSLGSQPSGVLLPQLSHHHHYYQQQQQHHYQQQQQQKVIYTQSVTSPKVCPGPQPAPAIPSDLQVLATNVQSRINEALAKIHPSDPKSPDMLPLPPPLALPPQPLAPPLAPPPLTPVPPLTLVSKGTTSTQYILPHPPPQKKRGVVITKLPGPLTTAPRHTGELMSRESSRHSSTSSPKSWEDPSIPAQSTKSDVITTGFSSNQPSVITLSPSPTGSLEERQGGVGVASVRRQVMEQDSDKESDSYAKLMSEETLASDGSSEGEGPGSKVGVAGEIIRQQKGQTGPASETDGRTVEKEREVKERVQEDSRGRDGDKKSSKKRRKSSSGGSSKKTPMFSVKLKDCFLHHLTWMDYRMVLLVPLGEDRMDTGDSHDHQPTPSHDTTEDVHSQSGEGGERQSGGGDGGGERRRRRKPVLKELSSYDMEEDEDDTSLSTTSSLHVPGPCFSVYELRNKLFQTLSPNAVYIYTYKNQIKSFKLPIHWVYILKRMGGMLESCHTCRLMDLEHVRGMCTHYGLSLPDTLNPLCRNELPKGRRVIDLSNIEPDSLGPLHLEAIPLCSFTEKGRPYRPKAKKSKKKWRKEEEQRMGRRAGSQTEGEREMREQGSKVEGGRSEKVGVKETKTEQEEGEEGRGDRGGMMGWVEQEKEWQQKHKFGQKSPPPLIRGPSSPISSRTKKKPCPFCGAQVLKRSKKCGACNRNFGVYTFGRKQCVFCGRVNLARMARCNECEQSLDNAPRARPKYEDESYGSSSLSHKKSDFIFGVRKRRKVHSVPLAFSGCYPSFSSSSSSSNNRLRRSSELQSLGESVCGAHGYVSGSEEMEEEGEEMGGEEEEVGGGEGEEMGEGEGGMEEGEGEVVLPKKEPGATKSKSKTKSSSKHTGYQYGHIPWADADITVLVDERGGVKFCLQEICAKVMVGHTKTEVFEMVRDLDLPLEQGNLQLLKKLQALGLHANRSPMCKLIASEELWLLLDALQEPVPEEVDQHLENINSSTIPLLSPGTSIRTAAVLATAPPTTTTAEEEEQTKSFESTLHEMQCSDGQYISVLRKWNGEQFACLPEIWRKYFPEVNRNHLSSGLRRMELETIMPTAQQATLLRSAQVISIRGAPGRLMKLEHMQALLDDFCIPLQLASGSSQDHTNTSDKKQPAPSSTATTTIPTCSTISSTSIRPLTTRPVGRPRIHSCNYLPQLTFPAGKILVNKEEVEYAQCMRDVMTAVESSDLVSLLEKTRVWAEEQAGHAYSEAAGLDSQLDRLGQLIHSRRELSCILSREMGFLNASAHGYMSEVVRLTHTEKQVLQNLDTLLNSLKISLL